MILSCLTCYFNCKGLLTLNEMGIIIIIIIIIIILNAI
jgi:hypothetical protein